MTILLVIIMLSNLMYNVHISTAASDTEEPTNHFIAKYYYATWGLTGLFQDAGLLAKEKITTNLVNMDNALQKMSRTREDIKRIRIEAMLEPTNTHNYEIEIRKPGLVDGNLKYIPAKDGIKVYIDGQVISNNGVNKSVELTSGTTYELDIEIYDNSIDYMSIYWKYTDGSLVEEKIPITLMKSPSKYSSINPGKIKQEKYKDQDSDGDMIPDELEVNGYTYLSGKIIPYDENLETPKYITDPNYYSTDGDPYSDFEEVTGIGMDPSVSYPGNDPLVPAYPEIKFVPARVRIVKKVTSTTSRNINTSASYETTVAISESSTKEDATSKATTGSERIEVGAAIESNGTEASFGVYGKLDVNVSGDYNSQKASEEAVEKFESARSQLSHAIEEGDSRYINTDDYADVYISGYFENLGLAPAYRVKAQFNLGLGSGNNNDTIASFDFVGGTTPPVIQPNSRFPEDGLIASNYTEGSETRAADFITLTKEQVDYLEEGVPFTFGIAHILKSAITPPASSTGDLPDDNDWDTALNLIDELSANVELAIPGRKVIRRKIYAKKNMNLFTALEKLFDAKKVTENGKSSLIILGEEIDNDLAGHWSVQITAADGTDGTYLALKNNLDSDSVTSFDDIELSPTMTVKLYKRSDDENIQAPNILQAYFDPNDKKIHAVVVPGQDGIKEVDNKKQVKAYYKSYDTDVEVTLTQSTTNPLNYYSEEIDDLSTDYDHRIEVISSTDAIINHNISFNPSYMESRIIHGYNYIDLVSRNFDQNNRNGLGQYVDRFNYEYYIVNLKDTVDPYTITSDDINNFNDDLDIPVYTQVANKTTVYNKDMSQSSKSGIKFMFTNDNYHYIFGVKQPGYNYSWPSIVDGEWVLSGKPFPLKTNEYFIIEQHPSINIYDFTVRADRPNKNPLHTPFNESGVAYHVDSVVHDRFTPSIELYNLGVIRGQQMKHNQLALITREEVKKLVGSNGSYQFQVLGAYSKSSNSVFVPNALPTFGTLGQAYPDTLLTITETDVKNVVMDILKDNTTRMGMSIGGQHVDLDTTNETDTGGGES